MNALPDPRTKPLLTVEEVVPLSRICERTLREAIARDEFPHRRLRRRIVIPTAELWRWLGLTPPSDGEPVPDSTGDATTDTAIEEPRDERITQT